MPFLSISSSPSMKPSTRLSSCPRRIRSTVFTILRIGPVTSRIRRQPKINAIPIQNSIITLEIKISLYCCNLTDLRSNSSATYPNIFLSFFASLKADSSGEYLSEIIGVRRIMISPSRVTLSLRGNGDPVASCISDGSR